MKSYIYTYSEKDRKHGGVRHCHKTVRIYRVVRNEPVFLLQRTDTFVDQFQLVMDAMHEFTYSTVEGDELAKHGLPTKAFEKHPSGGWKHYTADRLRELGIASFHQVT